MRSDQSRARMEQLTQQLLSRTRLERIIKDYGLYEAGSGAFVEDLVRRMQRDITMDFTPDAGEGGDVRAFRVGFTSSDPRLAMQITSVSRRCSLRSTDGIEVIVKGRPRFVDARIEAVRQRILATEETLAELRARNGREPLSQADVLPYEVLQEHYGTLLVRREEITIALNLERRQIGEQPRIIDAARLPVRPVGPSRLSLNSKTTALRMTVLDSYVCRSSR